ncbi:hypothetical protein Agabi119p4_4959 [Agaricus bisporus var. burnettii]|uniref:Uncharacterized protein n=1 Tax=Agaricus bisporus var. burnettii TaxID=192524 RepID=A0A8H7KHU3_AGABI|nr:hypothetical protein Agabi119p4_4959 [Agaricus bisporus var. burnettii]
MTKSVTEGLASNLVADFENILGPKLWVRPWEVFFSPELRNARAAAIARTLTDFLERDEPVHLLQPDVTKFHRTCPVIPHHKPWLVVQPGHPGVFYIDHAHPFGASSASSNAGMIANCAVSIWNAEGVRPLLKYEDDLAVLRIPTMLGSFINESSSFRYDYDRHEALSRIASLQVPWHPEKGSLSFSGVMVFIGLSWDLIAKTVSLPEHKRLKYLHRVLSFLNRFTHGKAKLRDVERIHGTLCYISFVFPDSRSRLPSLSHFAASFKGNEFIGRFPPRSLLSDLKWWLSRLQLPPFSRLLPPPAPLLDKKIYVDVSTSWGIGIVVKGRDITWLEVVAVKLITYVLDAWDICESRVTIHSDNQGTIGAMGKGRSPNVHINLVVRRAYSNFIPRFIVPSFLYVEFAANLADPILRSLLNELCIPVRFQIPADLSSAFVQH